MKILLFFSMLLLSACFSKNQTLRMWQTIVPEPANSNDTFKQKMIKTDIDNIDRELKSISGDSDSLNDGRRAYLQELREREYEQYFKADKPRY